MNVQRGRRSYTVGRHTKNKKRRLRLTNLQNRLRIPSIKFGIDFISKKYDIVQDSKTSVLDRNRAKGEED